MIKFTKGDIFATDAEAIVNTVNTVGVMGKGLALQFKSRFPANFKEYKRACDRGEVSLGRMFLTETNQLMEPYFIINFPTKGHWRSRSKLEDIAAGLDDLVRVINARNIKSIAVPPLGAGLGGLPWPAVRDLIKEKLQELNDVTVTVFEPNAQKRTTKGQARKLSRLGGLMVQLILDYSKAHREVDFDAPERGASHLEIQKLMYVAQSIDPSIKLQFEKHHYGPYSDNLRKMLREYEGVFLSGFGDGTDKALALEPIFVTEAGTAAIDSLNELDRYDAEQRTLVAGAVLNAVRGFEGPYPLELLTSVHLAVSEIGRSEAQCVSEFIARWNPRKQRLFTPLHVRKALQHLDA